MDDVFLVGTIHCQVENEGDAWIRSRRFGIVTAIPTRKKTGLKEDVKENRSGVID
jgi:hypothetical protein